MSGRTPPSGKARSSVYVQTTYALHGWLTRLRVLGCSALFRSEIVRHSFVGGHADRCIWNLPYQSGKQTPVQTTGTLFNIHQPQCLPETFVSSTLLSQPRPCNLWKSEQCMYYHTVIFTTIANVAQFHYISANKHYTPLFNGQVTCVSLHQNSNILTLSLSLLSFSFSFSPFWID